MNLQPYSLHFSQLQYRTAGLNFLLDDVVDDRLGDIVSALV
jgi:hypothetical protein